MKTVQIKQVGDRWLVVHLRAMRFPTVLKMFKTLVGAERYVARNHYRVIN